LRIAFDAIRSAAGSRLVVAGDFAKSLFDAAFDLIAGTFDLSASGSRLVFGAALGLHAIVTGDLANAFLDVAFGFVCSVTHGGGTSFC
jgi:hypothetical protein